MSSIDNESCPCSYGDPCDENCTCAKPYSSKGCQRCCSYGSYEQRKKQSVRLIEKLKEEKNEK